MPKIKVGKKVVHLPYTKKGKARMLKKAKNKRSMNRGY